MPRRKNNRNSFRKPGHDYRLPGYYLVTINTYLKEPFFGEINQNGMHPSNIGTIAQHIWYTIPDHEPTVKLDAFALMPDHIHGIIRIFGNTEEILSTPETQSFQPEAHSLSIIIRNYKAAVTRKVNKTIPTPPVTLWQKSFNDLIIHDEKGLENARWYIRNNPAQWWNEHGVTGM